MEKSASGSLQLPREDARPGRLWTRDFILICLTNLAIFTGFQLLMPALPLYLDKLGATAGMMGVVTGVFTISALLVRPWAGLQLDRQGRRGIYLAGLIIFVISVFLYNWATSLALLLVLRLVHGFGWGMSTTASGTIATDLIPPQRRGEGMGYFGLFGNLAMAVAPALGLWVARGLGFTVLFFTSTALALVGVLLASSIHYPPVQKAADGVRPALFEASALRPSLIVFFVTITYGGVVTFIAKYAFDNGIANVGLYFTVYAVLLMASRPVAGLLFDRRGDLPVVLPGMVMLIAAMLVLAQARSLPLFLVAGALNGLGFGAVQPTLQALSVAQAPPQRRGAANGTFFSAFDLGIGIGSILLGAVAQAVGFSQMYMISAGVGVLGLLVYLVWRPRRTR